MSRISKEVSLMQEEKRLRREETVVNFMGGDSYLINPLDTLKMIAASSIFGEASYYRNNVRDGRFRFDEKFSDEFAKKIFRLYDGKSTTEIFQEAIDQALSYDFRGTLELAAELRNIYNMRLNPQVIMVRAAMHPDRIAFTKKNPNEFHRINQLVMKRPDEPVTQLTYYLYLCEGKKNKIPSLLKRSTAKKLSSLSAYAVNKYKNAEIGMINAVRITHANSKVIDELMKTGAVTVSEQEQTWEQKRSAGMDWREIVNTTDMGHMAMLRNLRNIFTEIEDLQFCMGFLDKLKAGVLTGKQFPFRYYSAYNAVKTAHDLHHRNEILQALEECMEISIQNMPKLKGRTMCLSDNSGSAWGCITSEYGTVTIAEIDNLSAVIAAKCSEEGEVGKFGDKLIKFNVKKPVLQQTEAITAKRSSDVGAATEGGIWKFFRDAIKNKIFYDNIFIFSDQQAGTGGLYGTDQDMSEYKKAGFACRSSYVNVYKLVLDYRNQVNPKVNVFSIQTAGYNNILLPQMSYRCAMLTGWTGKEIQFAAEYIRQWDALEQKQLEN
ncbi:MAG: TROVE domain-containing protein [Oscillospiraceae bacterium]|nr:TROVE domain-containing protein [Oscillospiraceae bacterium]